jgi:phosphoglycolate phosphatase-like HAD superfamily hydrolase
VKIITDLSNTLVKQSSGDAYDQILKEVAKIYFENNFELNMNMGQYGNPFPVHIRTILENENISKHPILREQIKKFGSFQALANFLINNYIRKKLVQKFSIEKPEAIEGLELFIDFIESEKINSGIVTGDLRDVANLLLKNNTLENISNYFNYVTCGDDPVSTTRVNQIQSTYGGLIPSQDRYIFIDDASNGIKAMKNFAQGYKLNYKIVGVITGNSNEEKLYKAGAHIVFENIGELVKNIHKIK